MNGNSRVDRGADYTPEEVTFMMALDRFKRERQRLRPTWAEVFEVALQLGYAKPDVDDSEAQQVYLFERAVDRYCRKHRRKFPTACQVLSVLLALGYRLP